MKLFFIFNLLFILISFKTVSANEIDYNTAKKYKEMFNAQILSPKDIGNYQNIFVEQKKCNFKQADKYIFKINDKILMGHALAQRYLHPDCYRSEFLELSSWLKMYNDLPQARRIYRLAIRRMPEGYRSPPKPITAIGVQYEPTEVKKHLQNM